MKRREFLQNMAALAGSGSLGLGLGPQPAGAAPTAGSGAAARALFESLSPRQREVVAFEWDHRADISYGKIPSPNPQGHLLRAHVSNAWMITQPRLAGSFYSNDQRALVEEVLKELFSPGWPEKIMQQARDDTGRPWGEDQCLAFFGSPGDSRFQCVITGFHLTIRAGGGASSVFGGPISHGHQPSGFYERVGHPGNFFWHQALAANRVYQSLDGSQRQRALVRHRLPWFQFDGEVDRRVVLPDYPQDQRALEADIRFRSPSRPSPGLPVADMASDQQLEVRRVLAALVEPYALPYQKQILACLDRHGGLEQCSLAFYEEQDLGADGEWDNWRLEGPSFVWFFRGSPHVHIWIHVADDPSAPITSHFG